jgi:hypothetical protein
MAYIDPKTVISPKEFVGDVSVLADTGEGGWSLASLLWAGERSLALRWNGDDQNRLGNPQSRGIPTWFVLPEPIALIVSERFIKPIPSLEDFGFDKVKIRPRPQRIMDGQPQGPVDDEWIVISVDLNKGLVKLRNSRTDHFVGLHRAHIARVIPDTVADARNGLKNGMLELTVQMVFEDGNVRLEFAGVGAPVAA